LVSQEDSLIFVIMSDRRAFVVPQIGVQLDAEPHAGIAGIHDLLLFFAASASFSNARFANRSLRIFDPLDPAAAVHPSTNEFLGHS